MSEVFEQSSTYVVSYIEDTNLILPVNRHLSLHSSLKNNIGAASYSLNQNVLLLNTTKTSCYIDDKLN